jgi:hypothetical protein
VNDKIKKESIMTHTEGKWEVEKSRVITKRAKGYAGNVHYQNVEIARVGSEYTDEIKANTNLISSAPDLLSACKYALGVLESIPEVYAEQIADILDESIDTNRLESVIAKAEGK